MTKMKIIENFYKAIDLLVFEYQKNPFNFLYEKDLQSLLFSNLYSLLSGDSIEINGGYFSANYPGPILKIKTNPVKSEYPVTKRFDVAILDPNNVKHFNQKEASEKGWKSDPFWDQPVRAAAEIKYYQLGQSLVQKVKGVELDRAKLRKYFAQFSHFLGILIVFLQSESLKRDPFCGDQIVSVDEYPEVGLLQYVVTPSKVEKYFV